MSPGGNQQLKDAIDLSLNEAEQQKPWWVEKPTIEVVDSQEASI
jgi:hypothetical protein